MSQAWEEAVGPFLPWSGAEEQARFAEQGALPHDKSLRLGHG